MTLNNAPERTCIGCRARRPQPSLLRFVVRGGRLVDGSGQHGRGAYVCRDRAVDCFDAATKARRWGRALRAEVDPPSVVAIRASVAGPAVAITIDGGG